MEKRLHSSVFGSVFSPCISSIKILSLQSGSTFLVFNLVQYLEIAYIVKSTVTVLFYMPPIYCIHYLYFEILAFSICFPCEDKFTIIWTTRQGELITCTKLVFVVYEIQS